MRFEVLLAALVVGGLVHGQDAPKGVIAGTVLNEVTGEPVRRAAVVLTFYALGRQPESLLATSGADGRFQFDELEAGTGMLAASKNGYLEPSNNRPAPVQLAAGEQKDGVVIRLMPQGIIAGRVTDDDGEPQQNARVQVMIRVKFGGRKRWQALESAATNDRGEYRITNLRPGEYAVFASYTDPASDTNAKTKERPEVYATTYYPNALDVNSAQAVVVQKGVETGGIDMRLRRELAFSVRVRVDGASADLLRQTHISLLQWDATGNISRNDVGSRQLQPGIFELQRVRAGAWVVSARTSEGSEPAVGYTPIQITNADLMDVVVAMGPAPQLTGTFVFEGTTAKKVEWKRYGVSMKTMDGQPSGAGQVSVAEDGTFALRYWMPGKYILASYGPGADRAYLASVRVGNEERFGKEIDLTIGPPGPVKVIFRNDQGKVNGRLDADVEGSPGKLGTVVLVPVETHLRRIEYAFATEVRAGGVFSFGSVRPGEYLVCHMAGDMKTYYEDGEPPKESMDAAVRLKVEPNGTHTVTVKAVKMAAQP